jgi:hypothetical protein
VEVLSPVPESAQRVIETHRSFRFTRFKVAWPIVAVLVGSGIFWLTGSDGLSQPSNQASLLSLAAGSLPSSAKVCESRITSSCAREAAKKTRSPVAWIPVDTSKGTAILVSHEGRTYEILEVEGSLVEIGTKPKNIPSNPVGASQYREGAVSILVNTFESSDVGQVTILTWKAYGTTYELIAKRTKRLTVDDTIRLMDSLKYSASADA